MMGRGERTLKVDTSNLIVSCKIIHFSEINLQVLQFAIF